jgi:serine/threonine-protein kinase
MEKYRIEKILNRGGFGCVYRASQTELQRAVAIKVLQPASRIGFQDDSEAEAKRLQVVTRRFEREAQLVSQLRDPHTVMVYDFGHTPSGLLYMVLEYVDGLPLNEVLEREGALGAERSVKIIEQVLSSLQEAHAFNMLHRDIKPANIMLFDHVGRRDQVKVLDFGLAKAIDDPHFTADNPDLTDAEVLIGTPRYMSPEQIRGHRLTPATDMYSLGLVFYELLTGEKAVDAKSTMNTLARHVNDEPIQLPAEINIPNGLRSIVNRMLDKDAKRRLSSSEDILKLLDSWNSKEVLVPLPASALADEIEVVKVVTPPTWFLAGASALVVALVLGSLWTITSLFNSPEPKDVSLETSSPMEAQVAKSEPAMAEPEPKEPEKNEPEMVFDSPPEVAAEEAPLEEIAPEETPPEPLEEAEVKVEEPKDAPKVRKTSKPKTDKNKLDFLRTLDSAK